MSLVVLSPSTSNLFFFLLFARRVPTELGPGDVDVSLADKRGEEYVTPPLHHHTTTHTNRFLVIQLFTLSPTIQLHRPLVP